MNRHLRRLRENRLTVPTVLLLLGGISYGSLFTANKIAIDAGFPFIAYSFWQALFAGVVLLALSAIFSKPPSLRWENLRVFALVAVFGFLGPLLVVTYVADRLPPAVLTLCAALIPATTYALTLVLGFDRFRWLSVAGVLMGFRRDPPHRHPHREPAGRGRLGVGAVLAADAARGCDQQCRGRPPVSPVGVSALALCRRHDDRGRASAVFGRCSLEGECLFADRRSAPPASGACSGPRPARRSPTAASSRSCGAPARSSSRTLNYVVVAAGIFWASIFFGTALSHWVWAAVAVLVLSLVLINAGTARGLRERAARYDAERSDQ